MKFKFNLKPINLSFIIFMRGLFRFDSTSFFYYFYGSFTLTDTAKDSMDVKRSLGDDGLGTSGINFQLFSESVSAHLQFMRNQSQILPSRSNPSFVPNKYSHSTLH